MRKGHDSLPPILPVGTAVVTKVEVKSAGGELTCRAGAVGTIVRAPADVQHSYRVRLPGGEEVSLRRDEIQVLKHFQREGMTQESACGEALSPAPAADALAEPDLRRFIIYRCIVGSRAYGLATADSDVDRRGVYLPPADMQWSLFGVPEQLEDQQADECYWELQKCLVLALKANPNVLEVLSSPIVEHVTPLGQELLDLRPAFLSKLVYQTYNGYVMSQFKKLQQDVRARGQIKWKHAMHLMRLLLSGITILKEHTVPVRVTEHRDRLIAIRDGRVPWDEVNAWRLALHGEFEAAYAATTLPDRPDYAAANALLIKARRSMV
ncbi:MAG: DNA polymerase beta superfamily protein [Phycisphaerae bacterium]